MQNHKKTKKRAFPAALALFLGLGLSVSAMASSRALAGPAEDISLSAQAQSDGDAVSGGDEVFVKAASTVPAAQGELRGVWISYLDWNRWPKDPASFRKAVDASMDLCVSKGINAVFVQIRPDGDAMYPSAYFPWSKFASGKQGVDPGYDPFAYVLSSAHARGLQVHAWINPFRITGYLNRYSDLCASNPAIAWVGDQDASNDRWVLTHEGELYYNPAVPEVRQRIIDGVREVVERYEVDGVHFDDYFYPNIDDANEALWFDKPEYLSSGSRESIAAWRKNNINQLVRGVYQTVKQYRPQAVFGVSPEGYLKHLRLDNRLFVDIDTWMSQPGYVDYVMPQIYWGFEAKVNGQPAAYAFDTCLNDWITLKKKGDVTLYVGLPLYKTGTDAADGNETPEWLRYQDIMRRQVLTGRSTGQVSGYCLYDFSSLTREAARAEVENLTALFH